MSEPQVIRESTMCSLRYVLWFFSVTNTRHSVFGPGELTGALTLTL